MEFFAVVRAGLTVVRAVESGFGADEQWQDSYQKWEETLALLKATAERGVDWPWSDEPVA